MNKRFIFFSVLPFVVFFSWLGAGEVEAKSSLELLPRTCPGCTDLALDTNGNPVVIYFNELVQELRLISCQDPMCNHFDTTFLPLPVEGATEAMPRICPTCVSMALNPADEVIITFYDSFYGDLLLFRCADTSCTSPTVTPIDQEGDVGQGSDVAVMGDGSIVASYGNSLGDVKLAVCVEVGCQTIVIESGGLQGASNVLPRVCPDCTALALNNISAPVIQYFDALSGNPRLAVCNDTLCTDPDFVTIPVSGGLVGGDGSSADSFLPRHCPGCSAFTLANFQNPVISYFDDINEDLRLIICYDPLCDDFDDHLLDSSGETGQDVSLALDEFQRPVMSYYNVTEGDLLYISCGNRRCTQLQRTTLDSEGDVGQGTTLALRTNGRGRQIPVISYYDFDRDGLKLAFCSNIQCNRARFRTLDLP